MRSHRPARSTSTPPKLGGRWVVLVLAAALSIAAQLTGAQLTGDGGPAPTARAEVQVAVAPHAVGFASGAGPSLCNGADSAGAFEVREPVEEQEEDPDDRTPARTAVEAAHAAPAGRAASLPLGREPRSLHPTGELPVRGPPLA